MSIDSEFDKIIQVVYIIGHTVKQTTHENYIKQSIKRKCKGMFNIVDLKIDVEKIDTFLKITVKYYNKSFSFSKKFE